MRLYGIPSPDPVAFTSFPGIIRALSIMFYAAKGDMAVQVVMTFEDLQFVFLLGFTDQGA